MYILLMITKMTQKIRPCLDHGNVVATSRNGTGKYIHFRGFLIPTKQKVPSNDRWVYAPDVSCIKVRPESKGVFGNLS